MGPVEKAVFFTSNKREESEIVLAAEADRFGAARRLSKAKELRSGLSCSPRGQTG